LTGLLRGTINHGAAAVTWDGTAIPTPGASGVLGAEGGADLVQPVQEAFEFDLVGRTVIVFEVED
jgi:hypothetical protein